MSNIFPLYFLAALDKHGIQIVEGFARDSFSTDWAK
jgi:hypothetical protein